MNTNFYKGGVLGEPRFPRKNVSYKKGGVRKKLK
jgi:hypothetical protein